MKPFHLILGFLLAAPVSMRAQFPDPPLKDRAALTEQAGQLFTALRPAVAAASAGTVEVRVWRKRVGFGTVVAPERVLAKWSDVKRDVQSLTCRTGAGEWLPAKVEGVYREADLAVLKVAGLEAKPIALTGEHEVQLGQFLMLARPDGEAAAMGVVSVLPRSLLESDRAYLGIEMDLAYRGPGVRVGRVRPETGAEQAGMRAGDVVTGIKGQNVNGNFELSSSLQRLRPGEEIELVFRRGEEERAVSVKLGERPEVGQIPFSRMERMNTMGGHSYSEVRDGFRDVIQTDMQLKPEDCGAPVVNLDGAVLGIAVARAGRIKTFVMPARAVRELLETKPSAPLLEEIAGRAQPVEEAEFEDPFDTMRRTMEELQQLMREIEEMER